MNRDLFSMVNRSFPDTFWHEHEHEPFVQRRLHPKKLHTSPLPMLSNMSVVLVACCRDVENFISGFRRNVQWIVGLFKDYHILLGESDSIDQTLVLLQKWSAIDPSVEVTAYGNLNKLYKSRTKRIAHCRNNLLNVARSRGWLKEATFFMVLDVDRTASKVLTRSNFLSNFKYDLREWAVMTASQVDHYYDIWPLRNSVVTYDCWKLVNAYVKALREIGKKIFVTIHMKPIPKHHHLIEVQSAFGGFGIYQTQYLANCTYVGSYPDTDMDVCEHVSFHDCIRIQGGRIFINPAFQNC